jgi:hypothetical protein
MMQQKDIEVGGMKYTLTQLNKHGFSVGKRPWRDDYDKKHFIIQTVNTTFDKSRFAYPHTPIVISEVGNRQKFSHPGDIRVLDCPIKFPGSLEYRIPRDLLQFEEPIAKCVSFEHSINQNVESYYAYLTIDQGFIPEGTAQRTPGCHVDGFQGTRYLMKKVINRSYIAYDNTPTIFYAQPFHVQYLNETIHDFYAAFDAQAKVEDEVFFDPYSILLTNAYTVHKADIANTLRYRTFFRLTYSASIYDRFGNTHNPMFDYTWTMQTRDKKRLYKPFCAVAV